MVNKLLLAFQVLTLCLRDLLGIYGERLKPSPWRKPEIQSDKPSKHKVGSTPARVNWRRWLGDASTTLAQVALLEEANLTEGAAFRAVTVRLAQIIAYLRVVGESDVSALPRRASESAHMVSGILLARVRGYLTTEAAIDCLNEIIVGAEIDEWD